MKELSEYETEMLKIEQKKLDAIRNNNSKDNNLSIRDIFELFNPFSGI